MGSSINNKTILYVEDDTDIREQVTYFLKNSAKKVLVAVDGQDGIDQYMKYKPDIVITDIKMPKMDGLTMASEILKIDSSVPIIIISAFNDSENLHKAIKIGIKYYETKPLDLKKLITTLNEASHLQDKSAYLKLNSAIFENTQEAILVTDQYTNIINVNNAFSVITGYSKEEVLGKNPTILKSGRHDEIFYKELWQTLLKNGSWQGNIWNRKQNGNIYPEWLNISSVKDDEGNIKNFIAIFSDITQLKENEKKLTFMAHHDALTSLPNRLLLNARLEHSLNICDRLHTYVGVLFMDLDNFKHINDSFGHGMGDRVLQETANRLQLLLRSDDTLARIGGDEFVFVFENLERPDDLASIAEKIINSIKMPFEFEDNKFLLGASIGVSIYPNDGQTAEILCKHADTAMYSAKNAGKNTYRYYNKKMTSIAIERMALENALKKAIDSDEMIVYYQPKYNLDSQSIEGLEALVRWQHPEDGLLSPDKFIPLAEETGLIVSIGEIVLRKVCQDIVIWKREGLLNGRIAVNVSGVQINKSDFVKTLKTILAQTGALPEMIEIEITETAMMQDPDKWIQLLNEIKSIGIHISIDDFGTGYSSLNYLRRLPIDTLKIDRSFVMDLTQDDDADTITGAIISLAQSMGMATIAEGVETEEQKGFLRSNGCDVHQGFLYSKPVNRQDINELLIKRTQLN